MTDRFESALWKIDRARKHADDLEAEVRGFLSSDPYEVEAVGTPMTGPGSYRVRRVTPLPESIPLITGDAAHNIRSALDHFAWAAVVAAERSSRTAFPVWNSIVARTETRWHGQVEKQLKGAAPGLIAAVKELEPCQRELHLRRNAGRARDAERQVRGHLSADTGRSC
jgi:hypothetical protein